MDYSTHRIEASQDNYDQESMVALSSLQLSASSEQLAEERETSEARGITKRSSRVHDDRKFRPQGRQLESLHFEKGEDRRPKGEETRIRAQKGREKRRFRAQKNPEFGVKGEERREQIKPRRVVREERR